MSTYTQDASASSNSEAQELRCVITDIDALSQSGFSQIESIAKLALLSLQTPSGYRHIDDIATALEAIVYKLRTFKTASTAKQKTWVAIISMKMSANAGKLVMNQGAPLNHEQSRISTNYRPHEGSVRSGDNAQPAIDLHRESNNARK